MAREAGSLAVLLLLLPACSSVPSARADRGIHLELSADRTQYVFHEPVQLTARFSSSGDEALRLPPFWPWGVDWAPPEERWVVPEYSHTFVQLQPWPRHMRLQGLLPPYVPHVTIPAKGKYTQTFALHEVHGFPPPGSYRIWVEYEGRTPDLRVRLVSNVVRIRVLREKR